MNGFEHHRGSVDDWWEMNEEHFRSRIKVGFVDHACLSTYDATHSSWSYRGAKYEETQQLVRELVIRHSSSLYPIL